MAIAVKNISDIASKFVARAGVAGGDYTKGVNSTQKDQAALAAAAAPAWAAGVQAAAANGSFAKGVQKAGTDKWRKNSAGIGSQRYAQGVANAKEAYIQNFTPYLAVLSNLTLSQRYPRGDPRNNQRTIDVNTALNKARVSGSAG